MQFALVPAGKFRMGSPRLEGGRLPHEGPQHPVTISRVFYLARTEVTQAQWRAVMGTEPWQSQPFTRSGDDLAATYVNWEDAWAFCRKLSQKTGQTFRLPTEAEWEYACRAGTRTAYCFGDYETDLGEYAWFDKNAHNVGRKHAHPVGRKKPNAWGLCDMHGNVWEWCADRFDEKSYAQAPNPVDPTGSRSGKTRVLRGGSWYDRAWYGRAVFDSCRSAVRTGADPQFRSSFAGFRVVLVPQGK
jgi:formylglycine-generating enzyme required for sulfatase activity